MMPPTPPLPPRLPHRSIAGPVVLILMGILFLLGTMGIMDIHHLGSLFARFWPALLILWGVLKLIEYEQAKRYGPADPGHWRGWRFPDAVFDRGGTDCHAGVAR